MVVIRMARAGTKKKPFFHIVAADHTKSRDGKYLERLGIYNPKGKTESTARSGQAIFVCDIDRLKHWVSKGAQMSETVGQLVQRATK